MICLGDLSVMANLLKQSVNLTSIKSGCVKENTHKHTSDCPALERTTVLQ